MKTPTLMLAALAFSATVFAQVPPSSTPTNPSPTSPPSTTSPATPPLTPPPGGLTSAPAPSFESLDANSDGRLSATEAQADSSLATKFSGLDRQTKGYLTKEDFQMYLRGTKR